MCVHMCMHVSLCVCLPLTVCGHADIICECHSLCYCVCRQLTDHIPWAFFTGSIGLFPLRKASSYSAIPSFLCLRMCHLFEIDILFRNWMVRFCVCRKKVMAKLVQVPDLMRSLFGELNHIERSVSNHTERYTHTHTMIMQTYKYGAWVPAGIFSQPVFWPMAFKLIGLG